MNPLMKINSPITQLMTALNGGTDPRQLAQNILSNNPQARQMIASMQQQCGNRNPRDFVLEQCRNQGISEADVMQIAGKLGLS